MRRLIPVMALALASLACSGASDGSAEPPATAPPTTGTVASGTVASGTVATSTTPANATATTSTTAPNDGWQSSADREAELIELIAADATGPEKWIRVAARALAAEQLILERPGEVDLLEYFTADSPYLEETVRGVVEDFSAHGWTIDGLLVRLDSVEVLTELNNRVLLQLELRDGAHVVRSMDGDEQYESADHYETSVQITSVLDPLGQARVHDRTRVR